MALVSKLMKLYFRMERESIPREPGPTRSSVFVQAGGISALFPTTIHYLSRSEAKKTIRKELDQNGSKTEAYCGTSACVRGVVCRGLVGLG